MHKLVKSQCLQNPIELTEVAFHIGADADWAGQAIGEEEATAKFPTEH